MQPTVQLINYTGAGSPDPARAAANVLCFTKATRLNMTPGLAGEIALWSEEKVMEELRYMANTVPSSWEFVDYTFVINNVTRAFTHQLVRTRTGSYAQQAMRVVDMTDGMGWTYATGPTLEADVEFTGSGGARGSMPNAHQLLYHDTMATIGEAYAELVKAGVATEDARGLLPTNIHTNIVAKFNLRHLADTIRKRSSGRVQSEYRSVIEGMKSEVLRVHPWAALFLERDFDTVALELQEGINEVRGLDASEKVRLTKLIDQLRGMA